MLRPRTPIGSFVTPRSREMEAVEPERIPEAPPPATKPKSADAAPVPVPNHRAPEREAKTRIPFAEDTYDVTVRLSRRQTRLLDRCVADQKFDAGKLISRSEIIRALVDRFDADGHLRADILEGL